MAAAQAHENGTSSIAKDCSPMNGIIPTDGTAAQLVDLNEASIKNAIVRARKRGHITYDELNDALPAMTSSQLEYVMNALWQIGIDFIESDTAAEDEARRMSIGRLQIARGDSSVDRTTATDGDLEPLLDLNEASIKKLIARGKKRGYITYDELNDALPTISCEHIEDVMVALSQSGINLIENDEPADEALPPRVGEHDTEPLSADNDGDEPAAIPTPDAAIPIRAVRPIAKRIHKVRSKPMIEVTINGASVKIDCGADPATIAAVLDALKTSH